MDAGEMAPTRAGEVARGGQARIEACVFIYVEED
jgi:hypothetical protein